MQIQFWASQTAETLVWSSSYNFVRPSVAKTLYKSALRELWLRGGEEIILFFAARRRHSLEYHLLRFWEEEKELRPPRGVWAASFMGSSSGMTTRRRRTRIPPTRSPVFVPMETLKPRCQWWLFCVCVCICPIFWPKRRAAQNVCQALDRRIKLSSRWKQQKKVNLRPCRQFFAANRHQ